MWGSGRSEIALTPSIRGFVRILERTRPSGPASQQQPWRGEKDKVRAEVERSAGILVGPRKGMIKARSAGLCANY